MKLKLGYGNGVQVVEVPDANLRHILMPNPVTYDLTGEEEVRRALEQPIGSPKLRHIVRPGEKIPIDGLVV